MKKQIITYILFAACFLSACRSDYYDSVEPVNYATNDELTLTVSASDIVVSDGIASRADDQGSSTLFEKGECVGLIALDKEGRLLADNVPYKYDGTDWAFDADNTEGKQLVYYDAAMSTYIVYYPYDTSVDGVKDVSSLKSKSVFAHQMNQHSEEVYRRCDLMVWTQTEDLKKDIDVKLGHVRNSFSLDVKLNWELGLPSENNLEYRPLRDALIDLKVCLEDGTTILDDKIDYTFNAEDRSFRYILKDDYRGKITWRYTYRGESFGGESDVSATGGVRYVQHTIADISHDKAEAYDYYSYKEINGENYGFVMPWDAAECFETYRPIGIVFYVGQHNRDGSDYSSSGIGQQECHGYVVALADAFLPDAKNPDIPNYHLVWWIYPDENAEIPIITGITDTGDWSGFYSHKKIEEYIGNEANNTEWAKFPASYACKTYVGLDEIKGAPSNTSGWFLPTSNMLSYIMSDSKFEVSFEPVRNYADTGQDNGALDKHLFENYGEGYWSCTESSEQKDLVTERYNFRQEPVLDGNGNPTYDDKGKPITREVYDVRTLAEQYYAHYMTKDKPTAKPAMPRKTAKYVRPVLAF